METGLIYKATSPSGKSYIGQTIKELRQRKWAHKNAAITKKRKFPFYNAIRYYGWSSIKWEILEENISLENLDNKEIYYIKLFKSFESGYNATKGGVGNRGCIWNESSKDQAKKNHWIRSKNKDEILERLSKSLKGKASWNKGIPCSEKTKQLLSLAHQGKRIGYKYSKTTIEKLSGKNNSNYGKTMDSITREKISKSLSGENSPAAKLTWQIVESIRDKYKSGLYTQVKLSKEFNTSRRNIRNILTNQRWKI